MFTENDHPPEQVEAVEWHWLRPHLERGTLILVAPDIPLAEAAEATADDDIGRVRKWVESGRVGKPSPAQIDLWNAAPTKLFRMAIVQPYVLIQEP